MNNRPKRVVKQLLTSLHQAGVTHVPKLTAKDLVCAVETQRPAVQVPPNKSAAQIARPSATEIRETSTASPYVGQPSPPVKEMANSALAESATASPVIKSDAEFPTSLNLQGRIDALRVLQSEVTGCKKCAELAQSRSQTVFGTGNPQARLVFLGEAPGADEDKQGAPFVGKAGQKLNEIIENGMKLNRQDVYILNVLKCHPPSNRDPTETESQNCRDFLDRQLRIIQPEFICCLGGVAATNLLASKLTIGRLRGKFYDYQGIRVMATYHPAYLLRNPSARKQVWEDIQMLMQEMGLAKND